MIYGVVEDLFGYPLPGVNVVVKGTVWGMVTDVDGFFEMANVLNCGIIRYVKGWRAFWHRRKR